MPLRLTRKLLPHPLLSTLLVIVWCLLINDLSLGTVVFGAILGLLIPISTAAYWPDRPKITRPWRLVSYMLLVIWDIMVANVQVAMIVLFKRNDDMAPNWVLIPLDLRSPEAITLLAGTITLTPGTVSTDLSADGRALLVHALDAADPEAVRDDIKTRYERRLKEIFE
ncbi:MAG: multicomponent K+:H+ antiporter subunit E [Limimaricola cinnabarinus]|jgi:multicomponent K+:H+ antiporter subunit E|uniref:Na(+) H(+) antiporter subunit E n=1 Tax=Limimaricola cinnabarinus LL-001 TaxID=1337093 RepID=U3AJG6_9RHOB|nr:Na+/H+ antiporter subunit E [Limimaricola cinnabarinus]GAD54928.1 Na(+) H(+) antiporter subunit E [Limimaricola cinnabarinus LL-001]